MTKTFQTLLLAAFLSLNIAPAPTGAQTAEPDPTHPLMIEVMRQQDYPGSEIIYEQTLDPGVNYERFIVSYQSEGNRIDALLTLPHGPYPPTGWPVIIFNHGYIPPDQYRTTERYVAYVDGFARNGYIVLKSDYRGHGFSEGDAEGGYGSPAYTVDVLNAVASMKSFILADPNRIGMWGHSMGGHITLRAMVVSEDIRAGVIWAGVVGSYSDLMRYWWRRALTATPTPAPQGQDEILSRRRWRETLTTTYGTPEENPEFWAAISPNTYISDLSGPIQLHHGTSDNSVPDVLSTLLYNEILAVGLPVELYSYPGDDHNLSANLNVAMARSLQFFDRYVKNVGE